MAVYVVYEEERRMGWVIGIVVVIVIVVKILGAFFPSSSPTKEATEKLKNDNRYEVALKIKEALEEKGCVLLSESIHSHHEEDFQACATFNMSVPGEKERALRIFVSIYAVPVEYHVKELIMNFLRNNAAFKTCFLINSTGIVVDFDYHFLNEEMLNYLKIAENVLIVNGYVTNELYDNSRLAELARNGALVGCERNLIPNNPL
jgi:hypothetical protein